MGIELRMIDIYDIVLYLNIVEILKKKENKNC